MTTHHCEECGEQVGDDGCPDHPSAQERISGYTYGEWVEAAGGAHHCADAGAAWAAGEDPREYLPRERCPTEEVP